MANFGAKIINNAVGALAAQQAVIATTGNNIANANTPGYVRRSVELETRVSRGSSGQINVGNGVQIGDVSRTVDSYLERLLREASANSSGYQAQSEFLSRLEGVFGLTDSNSTIGSNVTAFFNAVNDLSTNPASLELRKNVIERANDLVTSIQLTYNTIAQLQDEANLRVSTEVNTINTLTSQIAELNALISQQEGGGNIAADERDKRTQLLDQLAEHIGYSLVEGNDGAVLITLSNGFPLVNGANSRELSVTQSPSFASGALPPSLSGGVLSYVVYDYDSGAGSAHIDLTEDIANGGGRIGGLLQIRGFNDASNTSAFQATGGLVEVASRVEAITRELLTTLNLEYLGPDEESGVAGLQASAADLDGNAPAVYGLFTFEYNGGSRDVDNDGRPDDLASPTLGIDNFSSILQVAISDPRDVAAARDLDSAAGSTSFATGDASNLTAIAAIQQRELNFAVGSYSLTATFDQSYVETVAHVGNLKSRADTNATVSYDSFLAVQGRRDEISAVSLDEEFTRLIQAQRAFQAAARIIRIADDLLDKVVNLI